MNAGRYVGDIEMHRSANKVQQISGKGHTTTAISKHYKNCKCCCYLDL